jgi:hypothetical protein
VFSWLRFAGNNVVMAAHDEDEAIDELYQAPLNEFTARRNALLKARRGADATRVRTLAKPSVVAWAVNQVYWRARPGYDRALKSGERLRRAQIAALEGKTADVRGASDAHRRAIAEAVAEGERLAGAAGSKPATDALMRTFEALSLAVDPPQPPGRLTDALQPAGFEALTGVTPKAQPKPSRASRDGHAGEAGPPERARPAHTAAPAEAEPARMKMDARDKERARQRQAAEEARRQAAEDKKRQAERRRRQAAVDRARIVEAKARADWERAQQALRAAQEQLSKV